jgi:hypothetical protein
MDRRLRELIALTAVSALACGVAFVFDYVSATAVFAVMTCSIGLIAVAVSRRS